MPSTATMTKLYDLVIRIPVFAHPDGRRLGEAQTVLPSPVPDGPDATLTIPRKDLAAAVAAVREFAAANDVTIVEA